MSILIKNVLLNNKTTNIYIENRTISEIGKAVDADKTIEARNHAAIPGLVNAHTHSAMTLMRGYADDMELSSWLDKKIWPLEARLKPEDVYAGTRLACLEMIRTGTTCFNDLYWHTSASIKAIQEMGLRAMVAGPIMDRFDEEKAEQQISEVERLHRMSGTFGPRIKFAIGPHSVYAVSRLTLEWAAEYAKENSLPVHIHLAETQKRGQKLPEEE
ncbi:MAG: amidohydrolase family protein [archaeon]